VTPAAGTSGLVPRPRRGRGRAFGPRARRSLLAAAGAAWLAAAAPAHEPEAAAPEAHPWARLREGDYAEYHAKFVVIPAAEDSAAPAPVMAVASIVLAVSDRSGGGVTFRRAVTGTRVLSGPAGDAGWSFDGRGECGPFDLGAPWSPDHLAAVVLASETGGAPESVAWDGPGEDVEINAPGVDALGPAACRMTFAAVAMPGSGDPGGAPPPPALLRLFAHPEAEPLGLARFDLVRRTPDGTVIEAEALYLGGGNWRDGGGLEAGLAELLAREIRASAAADALPEGPPPPPDAP